MLRLTEEAKSQVPGFVRVFEMTYYDVKREQDNKSASSTLMEKQLSDMVRKCHKLSDHLKDMHPDAVNAWASAGGVVGSDGRFVDYVSLGLIVHTAAEWAELALMVAQAARHAAKKGNPRDAMAAAMKDAAEFVYKKLTGKKRAGRAYDAHHGQETDTEFIRFLRGIYAAYGIEASARSRARRRRVMGNNSKK